MPVLAEALQAQTSCPAIFRKGYAMASKRSHAKKNAKRRAALKKKQALNLVPATPAVEKKGRRAPVAR